MSFVNWATAFVLLLVALAGLYGGVRAIVQRHVTGDRWGATLLGLLYLAGGGVAGIALALLLMERLL